MLFGVEFHCTLGLFVSPILTLLLTWHPGITQETDESIARHSSTIELTAAEQAYVEANPVLRVHAESEWPPYNFIENGELKGFSNEYLQLIAEKVGFEVEFVIGPTWDEFMTLLAQGDIDVVSNM
ncbi:MAG: transporter substrate-binding domain-containing protein, partial [Cyanothece sp. SIO2G6]|nr:transporter substrate-binding domain-containing protein [Cyanothece sp. SIO2G6]